MNQLALSRLDANSALRNLVTRLRHALAIRPIFPDAELIVVATVWAIVVLLGIPWHALPSLARCLRRDCSRSHALPAALVASAPLAPIGILAIHGAATEDIAGTSIARLQLFQIAVAIAELRTRELGLDDLRPRSRRDTVITGLCALGPLAPL